MKRSIATKLLLSISILFLFVFTSCKDSDENPQQKNATVRVNLTDAPADYDAVLVDIREVEIHTDAEGWVTLALVNPGIYNLLDFRNGLDTLIASGELSPGKVSEIRLILGPDNSVVKNGVSSPLKTPSAQQSGLKLKLDYTLSPGLVYEFWLDFDASRSVVEKGNGEFNLKPVLNVFTKNTTGSIEGFVNPPSTSPYIVAHNGVGDTATTTMDNPNGYFLIQGLIPGTYTVDFYPVSHNSKSLSDVKISKGKVTSVGVVNITQ